MYLFLRLNFHEGVFMRARKLFISIDDVATLSAWRIVFVETLLDGTKCTPHGLAAGSS